MMSKFGYSALLAALVSGVASAQLFGNNTLIVRQVSGVTTPATSTAAAVSLVGYNFNGSLTGVSVDINNVLSANGLGNFTQSASATSEGLINSGSSVLALSGYNAAAGTASVQTTAGIGRRVLTFNNMASSFATAFTVTDLVTGHYTTNNLRTAYRDTASSQIYTAGTGSSSSGGWKEFNADGTFVQKLDGPTPLTNTRVVRQIGGKMYGTAASGTTGLVNLTDSALVLGLPSGGSFYDFDRFGNYWLVADDSTSGFRIFDATGAQLANGGTAYQGRNFVTSVVRNSNGQLIPDKLDVYTVNSARTELQKFQIDFAGSTPTFGAIQTLATAPTGTLFTGVEAVPEPATMIMVGVGLLGLARRRRK